MIRGGAHAPETASAFGRRRRMTTAIDPAKRRRGAGATELQAFLAGAQGGDSWVGVLKRDDHQAVVTVG